MSAKSASRANPTTGQSSICVTYAAWIDAQGRERPITSRMIDQACQRLLTGSGQESRPLVPEDVMEDALDDDGVDWLN